MSAPSIIKIE